MIYKKLKKNITKNAILKVEQGADYTASFPIEILDKNISLNANFTNSLITEEILNNKNYITEQRYIELSKPLADKIQENETKINENKTAIDNINQSLALYATIEFLNAELAKYLTLEQYEQDKTLVNEKIANNENEIAQLKIKDTELKSEIDNNTLINTTQTQKLQEIETELAKLIEDQKDDLSYVGLIDENGTYKNGDYGFKADGFWYVYDNGWKKINQQISVDLSGYYNRDEINVLLSQKVSNDTYTQDKETLANRLSAIETKNTQQDTLINEKANTSDLDNYVKKNSDNTLTGVNEFKNNVYFNGDKTLNFGYSKTDTKLQISAVPRVKDSMITNPQGYIYYKKAMDPTDSTDVANKKYVDNSLVNKQDILMWKNKPIKNIVFEDSQVCIDWLNDNNSRIKVISYRGFGVHQGGYGTPIPWNYSSSERLWIQFNPNTGKWYWSESTNFKPRNMYVLIIEYVEM